jgi:hypothetical protein
MVTKSIRKYLTSKRNGDINSDLRGTLLRRESERSCLFPTITAAKEEKGFDQGGSEVV